MLLIKKLQSCINYLDVFPRTESIWQMAEQLRVIYGLTFYFSRNTFSTGNDNMVKLFILAWFKFTYDPGYSQYATNSYCQKLQSRINLPYFREPNHYHYAICKSIWALLSGFTFYWEKNPSFSIEFDFRYAFIIISADLCLIFYAMFCTTVQTSGWTRPGYSSLTSYVLVLISADT